MTPPSPKVHRIAIVTPYFWPVVGGITTFVDGLTGELTSRGFDVRIWSRYGKETAIVETGPENPLLFARWAHARMKAWRPDVVHAHGHWYALASAFRFGRPVAPVVVFSLHTDFTRSLGTMRKYLLSRLMARASHVTVVSEETATNLRSRFPRIKDVRRIPPGVRALHVDGSETAGIPELAEFRVGFPRLCSVGMMVWRDKVRGMEVLLQSMPLILRRYPDARLMFVGDGPMRTDLENLAHELHLGRAVRFAGVQANPAPFILESNLVVHCSFQDAFPQVALESLSLKRPVLMNREIAENISGDPAGMGILSCSPTPESIADAVCGLFSSETLGSEMATRGEIAVKNSFSWAKIAEGFLSLYGF